MGGPAQDLVDEYYGTAKKHGPHFLKEMGSVLFRSRLVRYRAEEFDAAPWARLVRLVTLARQSHSIVARAAIHRAILPGQERYHCLGATFCTHNLMHLARREATTLASPICSAGRTALRFVLQSLLLIESLLPRCKNKGLTTVTADECLVHISTYLINHVIAQILQCKVLVVSARRVLPGRATESPIPPPDCSPPRKLASCPAPLCFSGIGGPIIAKAPGCVYT